MQLPPFCCLCKTPCPPGQPGSRGDSGEAVMDGKLCLLLCSGKCVLGRAEGQLLGGAEAKGLR